MNRNGQKILTVYEHKPITVGYCKDGVTFDQVHLKALEVFYGTGCPYYSLINNGVKFNEFVGVLQIGKLTIEVLPKADQINDKVRWRGVLYDMLQSVGIFDIHAPSTSSLSLKSNSILDLYFEVFIAEVEILLHKGLVKRYRKTEKNLPALKGKILFSKHIRQNSVHQERFYTRHTVYDYEHVLNLILYKALKLVGQVNTNALLSSRIGALLLNFPELTDIPINKELFDRVSFDRKTEGYQKAIKISQLLLLNFHPDVKSGADDVLAIMFDMNVLWERFVFKSILRYGFGIKIEAQKSKNFWKPQHGVKVKMRPDIVVNTNENDCIVLDTKWKLLNGCNPSPDDLRQMFVYGNYYGASRAMLVYPGNVKNLTHGKYYTPDGEIGIQRCAVLTIPVETDIRQWQRNIVKTCLLEV